MQLTPGFSPRRHRLEELDGLVEALAPHRVAIELRNRGWVREERRDGTLGWFADRDVAYVCVDAPPGGNFQIMPSDLDAVTPRPGLPAPARPQHRRLPQRQVGGRARFGWRYEEDELEELARRAEEWPSRRRVHVAFNNNRGDDAPTAAQRFRALLGQAPAGEEQMRL